MSHADLDSYANAIRRRLAKAEPDDHGIAQELHQALADGSGDLGPPVHLSDPVLGEPRRDIAHLLSHRRLSGAARRRVDMGV